MLRTHEADFSVDPETIIGDTLRTQTLWDDAHDELLTDDELVPRRLRASDAQRTFDFD